MAAQNAPTARRRAQTGQSLPCSASATGELISIQLPLPNPVLHPNARPHYQDKAKAVKECRALAALVGRGVRPAEPIKAATYQLTFYIRRKMDYDGLGAWVKAYIDGFIVKNNGAGILADDDDFRPIGIERHCGCKETGVVFEIWPVKKSESQHG